MAKTLKDYKDWIDTYENPTESEQELIDGFKDILDEIFANYKNELAEKDKEIEELKQQRLFKEDFEIKYYCDYHGIYDDCIMENEEEPTEEQLENYTIWLKDNSKYDNLPSKDVK